MSQATRLMLTVVGLLVVAGGVGLYAWKGVYEPDVREEKKKDVNEHLFSLQGPDGGTADAQLLRLGITYKGETTVLEREAGKDWRITAPVEAPADKLAVDGIASQLQSAKFKYVADEHPDPGALEKYGLKTPEVTVEADATVSGQPRSVKLYGGAENSFNGSIFMRRDGEQQVWAAEGGVKWTFEKTTFDLRSKELLFVEEPKIHSIDVKTKNNSYTLERDAEKNWLVKTPKESYRADGPAITGAIGGLKSERATDFPKAPPAFDGADEITFKTDTGDVQVKLVKSGEKVYEQTGGAVAEVAANALTHFDRNPGDLRDKTVAVFKQDQVAKVVFHMPDDFTVEKDTASDAGTGETWRVTAPKQGPAKQFKLAALLWTLGSIKYTKPAEPKAKPKLDTWIALFDAQGKELARMGIGDDVPGAAGQKYLQGTLGKPVEADASRLTDLPTKVDDLLEAPPKDSGT